MTKPLSLLAALLFGCFASCLSEPEDHLHAGPRVLMETELGSIEIELAEAQAPSTCANFLRYVDGGLFDGGRFHRTVTPDNQPDNEIRIEVIQGSMNRERKEHFNIMGIKASTAKKFLILLWNCRPSKLP